MKIFKYQKVYTEIIKLILNNNWPVGSFMKSENELIKKFNVSRLTIRNVLSILENEGRIKRGRGKKTLILNKRLMSKSNSEIKDRMLFLNLNYNLINFKIVSNNFKDKFSSSKSLYYIERTARLKERHEIYFISRAYISKELSGEIDKISIENSRNFINLLIIKFGIIFSKSYQEIKAINLNLQDSKIFQVVKNIPALSNTWFFYDEGGKLILIDEEISIRPINVKNYYY